MAVSTEEKKSTFIWTEALGVSEILPPNIASYLKHHKQKLHVFLYDEDEFTNPNPEQIKVVRVGDSETKLHPSKSALIQAYRRGHEGTALLWSFVLSSGEASSYVHLDADNIYVANVLDEIESALLKFSVVGFRRPYARAANIRSLPLYQRLIFSLQADTVGTSAIGLTNLHKGFLKREWLFRKILGKRLLPGLSLLWPLMDFFDSVTKNLSRQTGIWFLSEGVHPRRWGFPADDFSNRKFVSLGGVGTGCGLWKRGQVSEMSPYENHALNSFAMYSAKFLDLDLGVRAQESPEIFSRVDPST
jgi:hypothetical protein